MFVLPGHRHYGPAASRAARMERERLRDLTGTAGTRRRAEL